MNVSLLFYFEILIVLFLCDSLWFSQTLVVGHIPQWGCLDQSCQLWLTHSLSLGKNPEAWAKDLKKEDFQLLCLDGTRKPVTEAQSCHLARVPNHAVVSRQNKADFIRRRLFNQQELFGRNGFEYRMFQLFQSSPKDLLFSDDTECLANLQDTTTYQKYLGPEYLMAIANVKQCLSFELVDACTFHGN